MSDVENAMVISLPSDPFYRAEPEDDGDRDDRIYAAWIAEQDDARRLNATI